MTDKMKIFFNGKFLNENKAKIDIKSYCFLRGDGVFETFPVYNGKPFMIDAHVSRLFHSAKAIDLRIPYTKTKIKSHVSDLIRKNKINDCILRIFVTRGGSIHEKDFRINFIMLLSKIKKVPEIFYTNGIKTITYQIERPIPKAKTLCFLPSILAYKIAKKKRCIRGFACQ